MTSTFDGKAEAIDLATISLAALTDHLEQTHHAYLRSELSRLDEMTKKVAAVHGEKDPRLYQLRETFLELAAEFSNHLMKEEQILFPMVRQLEIGDKAPIFHCGMIANPIRQMELEHQELSSMMGRLRELADGFTATDWACNTHRALLDSLADLERDTEEHTHKENDVLFPRALEMELDKRATALA